jgi:hypothetical protein
MVNISIRTMTGKVMYINCDETDTVLDLKNRIQKKDNTPLDHQRLIFNGKQIEDELLLSSYGISNNSIIHLILRLRGGMFHPTSARCDFVELKLDLTHLFASQKNLEQLKLESELEVQIQKLSEQIKLLKSSKSN